MTARSSADMGLPSFKDVAIEFMGNGFCENNNNSKATTGD
jgi:hypothetical protein